MIYELNIISWITVTVIAIVLFSSCDKDSEQLDVPIHNLDDIKISIDDNNVFLGSDVVFNIAGVADTLIFFSGEKGREYDENLKNGEVYTGKIDLMRYLYREEGEYHAVFVGKNSIGDKKLINSFDIKIERDPNPVLRNKTLKIGLGSGSVEGETFLVDFATIEKNSIGEASLKQDEIDFLVFWSGGSDPTGYPVIFAPSGNFTGWAKGREIDGSWDSDKRNSGEYIRIISPTKQEVEAFENMENRDDLILRYEEVEKSIKDRMSSEYDVLLHGPNERLNIRQWDEIEDIVYFKSESRDLYAAFKMSVISPTSSGVIELQVKSVFQF